MFHNFFLYFVCETCETQIYIQVSHLFLLFMPFCLRHRIFEVIFFHNWEYLMNNTSV